MVIISVFSEEGIFVFISTHTYHYVCVFVVFCVMFNVYKCLKMYNIIHNLIFHVDCSIFASRTSKPGFSLFILLLKLISVY